MKYLLPFIISILGAYAGKEGTSLAWRRWGIPALLCFYAGRAGAPLWTQILMFVLVPIFSIGYGEDAPLRKFYEGKVEFPNAFTRGTIALLLAAVFMPLWVNLSELMVAGMLVLIWAVFGGDDIVKNEGQIQGLLVEDLVLYGGFGVYAIYCLSLYGGRLALQG